MILVTGGTGLLGSHLLFKLTEQGLKVRAIYRSKASIEQVKTLFRWYSDQADNLLSNIQWVKADINDIPSLEMAFEGISQVYHTAALISFTPSEWNNIKKINIEGTANIVNLCLAFNIKKLCYASSIAAVGKSADQDPLTEESEWQETEASVYAISKHLAEMEVWRGSQEGLKVIIINPGIIFGPGNWNRGSLRMFKQVARGLKYYFPGGTGFVCVRDVIYAMIQLMNSDRHNERYIAVAENLSFQEVFKMISLSMGLSAPSKKLPIWVLQILWRIDWVRHFIFKRKRRLVRSTVISLANTKYYRSTKLENALNFKLGRLQSCIDDASVYFQNTYPEKFAKKGD